MGRAKGAGERGRSGARRGKRFWRAIESASEDRCDGEKEVCASERRRGRARMEGWRCIFGD